jgi:cyclophilin family peptidyl-prolyl cis-trans isomerase
VFAISPFLYLCVTANATATKPVDFLDMGTNKRARQKANRQTRLAEVEAEEVKETREASTKKFGKIAAVVAALIAIVVLFNMIGGGGDEGSTATFRPTPAPEGEPTPTPEIVFASLVPDDFEPFAGTGALSLVKPEARNGAYDQAPPMTIDPTKSYAAVLDTSIGPIRLTLFADEAPLAVNNFVALARDGFYDNVTFHRVMADFMAQAGDPTGTGTGGPGYSFADEFGSGRLFDARGQLALANSGPNTNGSQFFITTVPADWLDGLHTIFGEIADDAPALDEIPITGEGETVVIESVRIIES